MNGIEISIEDFFNRNSKLFVVIGVFIALSFYLIDFLSEPSNYQKTIATFETLSFNPLEYVIVACYIIVVLIFLSILKQLIFDEKGNFFPYTFLIGISSLKRIILIMPIIIIPIFLLISIVTLYIQIIYPFFIIFTAFLGFVTFFSSLYLWTKAVHKFSQTNPVGCISLFCFSILLLIFLILLTIITSLIIYSKIQILLGFYIGILGSGTIILLIFSIILCLYRIFQKIRKGK